MPKHWRLLLVLLLVSSVAPVSAERLGISNHNASACPHARAEAAADATNAAPFLGLKRRSATALMP